MDQLQAHRHGVQRVVAALVTHDPDPSRSPFHRHGSTAVASLLVAALALGATALYAIFTNSSGATSLRDANVVFVEKTGAQYVYYEPDGQLHPVLNYTSGQLIAGSAQSPAGPVALSRGVLPKLQRKAGLQVGAPLGIPDAPSLLPTPADLIRDPWQLCTHAAGTQAGPTQPPQSLLLIGAAPTGGRALAAPVAGTAGEALLVSASGQQYLVFANHRLLLRRPDVVFRAFGWIAPTPDPVDAAWLHALPAGPDIEPLQLDNIGMPSPTLGVPIGQLYKTPGTDGTDQWAVALGDGILPISQVQASLLQTEPVTLAYGGFSRLPKSKARPTSAESQQLLPTTAPTLVSARTACVTVPDATTGVTAVHIDATLPASPAADTASGPDQPARADRITVPLGRGVLVEAASSPTAPAGSGTISIVTAGRRYPITDREALAKLGYGQTAAHRMPSQLVALLPEGPALGIEEALKNRG